MCILISEYSTGTEKEYAVEMACSNIRYGPGVTREVGLVCTCYVCIEEIVALLVMLMVMEVMMMMMEMKMEMVMMKLMIM